MRRYTFLVLKINFLIIYNYLRLYRVQIKPCFIAIYQRKTLFSKCSKIFCYRFCGLKHGHTSETSREVPVVYSCHVLSVTF